jgi:hypothetical protein
MVFLYMLFISMYIRIPHIPNRMAFTYAVDFHVHTYSSYSQPYGFYVCCSFPLYIRIPHIPNRMALICAVHSMYIRIPRIPNRMAFMYAVHFHVHTYSQPYSSLRTEEVRCVAAGRRKFAASQDAAEDTADSILLQTRGARMAFMCQRTRV